MTESKLLAEDRAVVAPGQVLAEGMEYFPGLGTYRQGDKILANQVGLLKLDGKVLKTTPLASPYLPAKDDVVIGKVVDVLMSGWRVNLNGAYSAVIPLKDATFDFIRKGDDLTEYFDIDDHVVCKITQVTSQNLIDVSMKGPGLHKLRGGQFISINPAKVPRVIGRHGSMVSLIKHATDCQISVGQNGVVWISGEPEQEVLAVKVVEKVARESHVQGLTDKIKTHLEKATGKKIDLAAIQKSHEAEMQQREQSRPQSRPPREGSFRDNRSSGGRPPRRDGGRPPRKPGGRPPQRRRS